MKFHQGNNQRKKAFHRTDTLKVKYQSIVPPLTLLSAYLLLSKPRKKSESPSDTL